MTRLPLADDPVQGLRPRRMTASKKIRW